MKAGKHGNEQIISLLLLCLSALSFSRVKIQILLHLIEKEEYYIMTTPHYILPPHLLEEIGRSGDEQQRQLAFQLSQDNAFRTMRATASATLAFGVQRRASEGLLAQGKKLRRMVADVQGTTDLPGVVVRREGDGPVSDEAVNQAYDGLGYTHHFYLEVFRRHSIDDDGMPLEAIVHYSQRYANAFWDGRYMVFGDGDGTLFNRFTAS